MDEPPKNPRLEVCRCSHYFGKLNPFHSCMLVSIQCGNSREKILELCISSKNTASICLHEEIISLKILFRMNSDSKIWIFFLKKKAFLGQKSSNFSRHYFRAVFYSIFGSRTPSNLMIQPPVFSPFSSTSSTKHTRVRLKGRNVSKFSKKISTLLKSCKITKWERRLTDQRCLLILRVSVLMGVQQLSSFLETSVNASSNRKVFVVENTVVQNHCFYCR